MAFVFLFTQQELEARVGKTKLREALDHDNTGSANPDAVERVMRDASSYVLEAYYGTFTSVPDDAAIPEGLKRLSLDAARAYLAQGAPEVLRIDWERLFKWVKAEVDDLRNANRRVGQSPPDTAKNVGGITGSIGTSTHGAAAAPVFEGMNTDGVDW